MAQTPEADKAVDKAVGELGDEEENLARYGIPYGQTQRLRFFGGPTVEVGFPGPVQPDAPERDRSPFSAGAPGGSARGRQGTPARPSHRTSVRRIHWRPPAREPRDGRSGGGGVGHGGVDGVGRGAPRQEPDRDGQAPAGWTVGRL